MMFHNARMHCILIACKKEFELICFLSYLNDLPAQIFPALRSIVSDSGKETVHTDSWQLSIIAFQCNNIGYIGNNNNGEMIS